jgi:hypothetical protein
MEDIYGTAPLIFEGSWHHWTKWFRLGVQYLVWYVAATVSATIYTFLSMEMFTPSSRGTAHGWLSWVCDAHEVDIEEIPYIAWVLASTLWEFAGGIHTNAKVDQCDQRGQRGPSYPILVWDFIKGSKAISARHNFHPTYPAHIGIGFLGIWAHWAQHGGGKGCYPRV